VCLIATLAVCLKPLGIDLSMFLTDLLADLGLMPLRAIAFQTVLLMLATSLEAMVLRQRLRLGYQTSIRYSASINLLATTLGWLSFLALERLLPVELRQQVISYILFNRFYPNGWSNRLPVLVVVAAIGAFFLTYWVKLQGLRGLMVLLGLQPSPPTARGDRQGRYRAARDQTAPSQPSLTLAVLHANALSFTAMLLVLLIRLVA
jgi:hypothetical protein